jgi:hypothetical protein
MMPLEMPLWIFWPVAIMWAVALTWLAADAINFINRSFGDK